MRRAGNVWTVQRARVFSSLKIERTAAKTSRTRAKADMFDDIEKFYTRQHLYQALGSRSSEEFDRQESGSSSTCL